MMMTKKSLLKLAIATSIIAVLVFVGYLFLKPKPNQTNYITAQAETQNIEKTVLASGKLEAKKMVNVGVQVSGEVKALYVKLGDTVNKGDVIAQIDAATQQNNLNNQVANLEQNQAGLQSRIAELNLNKVKLKRLQPLLAIDAISKQEYDIAKNAVELAQAAVATAKAQLKQAQAQVDTARQNLGYTNIVAPIDGTVVAVVTEQGQTVNSMQSAPTIVTLAQVDDMRIKAKISEADVLEIKNNMPVYFTVLGNPDKKYHARLEAVEPAPEKLNNGDSAVYYNGYFTVPNPNGELRIDMTAQVSIVQAQANNVLTIPAAAIKQQQGKTQVQVLDVNNQTQLKPVTIGINNRITAQVLSGLKVGDTVVLSDDNSGDGSNTGKPMMRH